jgi:predicted cupin superfamily sugar epimerase
MHDDVTALIERFGLSTLPSEGTLFVSTWRSHDNFADGGPHGTAMIGLYCNDPLSQSLFHRLPVDEVWHFYAGDPLRLMLLFPDGTSRDVVLGPHPLLGHELQYIVPAGVWQAGHVADGGRYALFGCTMAPGFTGSMYEGGLRDLLATQFPDRIADIARFGCGAEETAMPTGFAT